MTAQSVGPEPRRRPDRRPNRRAGVGRLGEDLAADYVSGLGWSILDRNWRNRYGELDLIAADGRRLVVVEVKTRASRIFNDPVAAVTRDKLMRMRRLTRMWLAQQDRHWEQIRFDIISIQLDPAHPMSADGARVRHHVNIVE
ncbi:YraN family protein [Gordonia sp. NPDC003950]